jgi:hypothetical protein
MAAHTAAQQSFIVRRLAQFYSPIAIVEAFVRFFPDTACTEADVIALDHTQNIVDPDLIAIFEQERLAFLSRLDAEAPTKDKRIRLVELHRIFIGYRDRMRLAEARSVLSQIALEMGEGGGVPDGAGDAPVRSITRTIVDPAAAKPA